MNRHYITIPCTLLLFVLFLLLFIYNFIEPKLFRYGCVKCEICCEFKSSCGINCTSYDYGLIYRQYYGSYHYNCYNAINCELPSENYCEIIGSKYRSKYLSYVTDKTITWSNQFNGVLLGTCNVFSIVLLILNIIRCLKEQRLQIV